MLDQLETVIQMQIGFFGPEEYFPVNFFLPSLLN